jgi:DNA-binding CsgD family transcriptional regulator
LIFGEDSLDNCPVDYRELQEPRSTKQSCNGIMKDESSLQPELNPEDSPPSPQARLSRARKAAPAAMALVIGLAALSAQASESELVRDIQRYCTVCWRNARLDPTVWDDCTQEVCCRLLGKAREGQLDLTQVLADDTPERRELVRAIDMVRKRVQRAKRHQPIDGLPIPAPGHDERERDRLELGEILETARTAVLSRRQDRILELWMRGWPVPDISAELNIPVNRVSDEKYKALRKLEHHLRNHREDLGMSVAFNQSPAQRETA